MRARNAFQHAVRALLVGLQVATFSATAGAQDNYPNRAVKLIAPQAPGGGVDLVARIISERLHGAMGSRS
jgi:tripartite-type tricarboxylate transporter receptor subunit TctC